MVNSRNRTKLKYIHKDADQSVTSSTTLVTATGLEIAIKNGFTYSIISYLSIEGGATPDVKTTYTITAGSATGKWGVHSLHPSVALGTAQVSTNADWPLLLISKAVILCTGDGTLSVQFAQNTSDALAVTILKDSYIKYMEHA